MKSKLFVSLICLILVLGASFGSVFSLSESCIIHLVDSSAVSSSLYGEYFNYAGDNNQFSAHQIAVEAQDKYLWWFKTECEELALPGQMVDYDLYYNYLGSPDIWRVRLHPYMASDGCYATGSITKLN
ncbi:MAG TPA: hypothetical protein DD640_06140 [Clostridiales bacterium]|nr:hypothetical protein [Clostridiales bacterium]